MQKDNVGVSQQNANQLDITNYPSNYVPSDNVANPIDNRDSANYNPFPPLSTSVVEPLIPEIPVEHDEDTTVESDTEESIESMESMESTESSYDPFNPDTYQEICDSLALDYTPTLHKYTSIPKIKKIHKSKLLPFHKMDNGLNIRDSTNSSKGEKICRETMESIYGVQFHTVRPDWFRNPETGASIELDCYNDDLKLAVEYNGEQHYKWPNNFSMSKEEFINQMRRDKLKTSLCDKLGIYLIVVPYTVPHEEIPAYIVSLLPETIRETLQKS
jgi:hypothetical protein